MTIPYDRERILLDLKGDIPGVIRSNVFYKLVRVWSSKFNIGTSSRIDIFAISIPVDLIISSGARLVLIEVGDIPVHSVTSPQIDPNQSLEQLMIY